MVNFEQVNQFICDYYKGLYSSQRLGQAFVNCFNIVDNEHNLFYIIDNQIAEDTIYLYFVNY